MKRTLIFLLGLGLMACVAGEARLWAAASNVSNTTNFVIIAHPDYDDQQKGKMFQTMVDEEKRLLQQPSGYVGRNFISGSRIGDMGYIAPGLDVSVFRVVDEWNSIFRIADRMRVTDMGTVSGIQYIWLEDYPTADLFTGDWVKIVGRIKIVDSENSSGMPGLYGDTNLMEMKVRVVRLMSQDELKNPTVYEAREAKERVRKAEAAGDESEKDKALRRAWTVDGNREWAIYDGVKNGQVSLRITRIHPVKRVVEETVKTYPVGSFSKEDKAWIEEMAKN